MPRPARSLPTVSLLLALCSAGCSTAASAPAASRGPSASVLLVLAHPDDETMLGATLGRLKERSVPVVALYATRGEGGKRVRRQGARLVEEDPDDRWLAGERRRELVAAARHFGIARLLLLEQPDQPLADPRTGQPTRDVERFLRSGLWRLDELRAAIVRLAEQVRPEVVITLRPDCAVVHAHHQAIGRLTLALFEEGRLGSRARQVYGVTEVEWYPAASFPARAGAIPVPVDGFSPRLGMSYAAFARQGARLHRTQLVAYQGLPHHPELLVPLGPAQRPDPLVRLLGLEPAP